MGAVSVNGALIRTASLLLTIAVLTGLQPTEQEARRSAQCDPSSPDSGEALAPRRNPSRSKQTCRSYISARRDGARYGSTAQATRTDRSRNVGSGHRCPVFGDGDVALTRFRGYVL